ncbi:MAG TPA: hypothetical protein VFG37_03825 [Planctomycetota bacterium]|nr:hypothetical protein [Planctomycetota bacterium]
MTNVSVPRGLVLPGLALLVFAPLSRAAPSTGTPARVKVQLIDARGDASTLLQAGDSVIVRVKGLDPRKGYDLALFAGPTDMVGLATAAADKDGEIEPLVLWYDSGITGPDPAGTGKWGDGFSDLRAAESYLQNHPLHVEVREADAAVPGGGPLVATAPLAVQAPRSAPWIECTDLQGSHRNSFENGKEPLCVSGAGFPAGSTVELYFVADRSQWSDGDPLVDVSGYQARPHRHSVLLGPTETSFTVPVWPAQLQRNGRFDVVARISGGGATKAELSPGDLLAHGLETGVHVVPPAVMMPAGPPHDLNADLAGRRTKKRLYPGFEYSNTFLRHDSVLAALDPSDIPGSNSAVYARIYVVAAKSKSEWQANPTLHDVTEAVDGRIVKAGTLELSIGQIWGDADPTGIEKIPFDIVVDLGLHAPNGIKGGGTTGGGGGPPPATPAQALFDNVYTPGTDPIDKLQADGFYVVDDPSEPGPFPVGRTEYDFPDAYDVPWGQYADPNVDVRAVVAYPGQSAGTDVPVFGNTQQYPIVFILHGNHGICLGNPCDFNCPLGSRIPNHKGYDYLLDLWASHGFIGVSIDGFDLTGCPQDRFIERAALILEHIRYWEDWNNPVLPDGTFNGRFWNRIDVGRVGIAGHSRGGEGAAAAVQINHDLALGHNIKACITIAPTDFNSANPPGGGPASFVVNDTPFFNIMGANDGDVWDVEGARIFDRAGLGSHKAVKSQAFIYGASHNPWNTVWIDPAWGGFDDAAGGPGAISHQEQQDTARVYMTSFWMAFLQDRHEMLAFHRGRLDSPKLSGVKTYWNFEDDNRLLVDGFQDKPTDPTLNTLGGTVTVSPAPVTYKENGLRPGDYDNSFFQDTNGLIVGWNQTTTYTSEIPTANQDVSAFSHLHVRAALIVDGGVLNPPGQQQSFLVNLEDANGVSQTVDVSSAGFAAIPVGYAHPNGRKSMLSSIRVPLRAFTADDSGLDLTKITKIVVTFASTGLLAIDDIQFTR